MCETRPAARHRRKSKRALRDLQTLPANLAYHFPLLAGPLVLRNLLDTGAYAFLVLH
jgi:uncharacterized iron-regulated membrane protein